MSDNFMMLVDTEVSLKNASSVSAAVINTLRDRQLIAGDLTPDCVLGGSGYRPGPAVPNSYAPGPNEGLFWDLLTVGVEPSIQRSFNHWALGPSCEDFTCPKCNQRHTELDTEFGDAIFTAVGQWHDEYSPVNIVCPACNRATRLTDWHSTPPLGFGNLSFRFWNWPPFDLPAWKLDIPALIRDTTGHKIVVTWGRL